MPVRSAELADSARARGVAGKLNVAGVETAYWHYPSKVTGAPSIVFIHGYRGNHHGLEAIAGALSDFDLYIPDLPGFGQSGEFVGAHSINHYAGWVKALVGALQLDQPVLLGHSFGTIVSAAATAQGAKVSKVVLVNPVSAPALKGPRALMTLVAQGFHALAARLPERVGNGILRSFVFVRGMSVVMTKSRDGKLRRWVHAQHDSNFNNYTSLRVATEGYAASISNNVGEYAELIKQPTLLIAGQKDDITSVAAQREVRERFADAKLVVLQGVGHLTHYESPDAVAAEIREFLGTPAR